MLGGSDRWQNEPAAQHCGHAGAASCWRRRPPAEARGRFFNTGNGFNVQLPPVPDRIFTAEPARALDPATPTGLIACDISADLACRFPATTPLVLAHYARIRAGETLTTDFVASGVIAYVIAGSGTTQCAGQEIAWSAGDLFILPGGEPALHAAGDADAVLWIVTNEPQLAFENLRAPAPGEAPTELVHYRADEIARQIDLIYEVGRNEDDRRFRADLLRRTAGSHAQHPADADGRNELAAGWRGAAPASAQLGGRVADHQGRPLFLGHRRQAQGLGAVGDHDHAACRRCTRTTTAATSRRCS